MTRLLPALIVGFICFLTADQQLDSVSLFRVGNNTICPSDVVTLECSVQGDTIQWYCADGNSRTLVCPAENIFPLECDEKVYEFYDCEKNGSETTSSLFFNTTTENILTCRNGVNISQTMTINITFEDPPSPVVVLSDQIYEVNNTHVVNVSWHVPASVQEPIYEVRVTSAAQGQTSLFLTQQLNILLKLAVNTTYHITIKTTTCDGSLKSSESQPLTVELNEPAGVTWCNVTPTHENKHVQWSPLPDSQNISSGVYLQLLYYNVTYTVAGRPYFQLLQPVNCDTVCSLTINSAATHIFVLGLNAVGPGEKEPCNLGIPDNDTENTPMMEGTAIIEIVTASTVVGTVVVLLVAGITCFIVVYVHKKNQPGSAKGEETFGGCENAMELQDAPIEPNPKQYPMKVITGPLHREQQHFHDKFTIEKGSSADKPLKCGLARGVAVSESRIVITDEEQLTNNAPRYLVRVFNRQPPNELLFKIVGQFSTPRGVAIDGDGNIYIADSNRHRILKFNEKGKYLDQRRGDDKFGSEKIELHKPYGLHIENGLLYVCDSENSWIQIFDLELNLQFRLGGQHANPRFLFCPVGIAYNPADKHFYVVDTINNLITKIQISFERKSCYVSEVNTPSSDEQRLHKMRGIVVIDGHIIVTHVTRDSIVCLTVDGEMKNKRDIKYPIDLAVYEDTVYVCSGSDEVDTIQQFSLNELINNV